MGEGAPWVELLVGLGRVGGETWSPSVILDPDDDDALTLRLTTAIAPTTRLSAEIAMSCAEARRIAFSLARPDEALQGWVAAEAARWSAAEPRPNELLAAVAIIRALMRAEAHVVSIVAPATGAAS